ncbi:MAG: phosphatase PAP2 family protein, partial [Planctomycetaceae bacterium]|nr:phosphatase PAP2 family protein [Planctomycetaceae bacterium]
MKTNRRLSCFSDAFRGIFQQDRQRRANRRSRAAAEVLESRILLAGILGDVDGDNDADANDSFLTHLVNLAGTDTHIDLLKGGSPLTAAEIRENVALLQPFSDVDGDVDFDANDSFLIHLVRLAGTDQHINLLKGASAFSAERIRGNVDTLAEADPETVDPVLRWNQAAIDVIQNTAAAPPAATRSLAMLHTAIYDVVSSWNGKDGFYVREQRPSFSSLSAAVSAAADRILRYQFPNQEQYIDSVFADALTAVPDGVAEDSGVAFGRDVADRILDLRAADGFDDFLQISGSQQPGVWRPTAPAFAEALLPQWSNVQTFVVDDVNSVLPAGPPSLSSAEWTADYNEVRTLGAADSTTRTADQTQIAKFWADSSGTPTPPGHWNQIAESVSDERSLSLFQNARLFAALNLGLADAAVVSWRAKYQYEFWRPITAIHEAAADGNDNTSADPTWSPLVITPAFPEYVSGHSTFSGTAAGILTALLGDNVSFSTTSASLPGVERSFSSFEAAAEEAGRSRIYGGIHFEFSNQDGLAAGHRIADAVLQAFSGGQDSQPPRIITPPTDDIVRNDVTITGQILDTLSGVASATVSIDQAAPTSLTLTPQGRFEIPVSFPAAGSHVITIQAVDRSGNSATRDVTVVADGLDPVITVTAPGNNAALNAASRLTGTVDGTGSAVTEFTYRFDNERPMPVSVSASGSFDVALNLADVSAGTHTLSITARDAAGNTHISNIPVSVPQLVPFTVRRVTPQDGTSDVGVTFRPQVFFSRAVDATTLTTDNFFVTDTTGTVLPSKVVASDDGTFAWLFLNSPMPGSSTITVHVDGLTIFSAADAGLPAGQRSPLDADGDGQPGGIRTYQFTTVSLVPLSGTSLSGIVADPGPDLSPGTSDDVQAGPDGILMTADDVYLHPIAGVTVYILGLENASVTTDAQGRFAFDAVPAGNVKLAVDGRTAVNAPDGVFFPEMVMDLQIRPGTANTVMAAMEADSVRAAQKPEPGVYLPRLQQSILKTVSNSALTVVGVDGTSAPNLTPSQRTQLTLEIQPGSLIGADGQPLTTGQVGVSTVPPELVRDMLPAGLLQHTFDITIQAPDAATFATPATLTMPNVFNAAPGTKLNFLSFDHTTGRLVIDGTGTVSADGLTVTTDPDTGVTHPGWHGLAPAGSQSFGTVTEINCVSPNMGGIGTSIHEIQAGVIDSGSNMLGISTGFVGAAANASAWRNFDLPQLNAGGFLSAFGAVLDFATVVEDVSAGEDATESLIKTTLSVVAILPIPPWNVIAGVGRGIWAVADLINGLNALKSNFDELEQAWTACTGDTTSDPARAPEVAAAVRQAEAHAGEVVRQQPHYEAIDRFRKTFENITQNGNRIDTTQPNLGWSPDTIRQLANESRAAAAAIRELDKMPNLFSSAANVYDSIRTAVTAFPSSLSSPIADAFVAVTVNDEILRTRTDANGTWDLVLPPNLSVLVRIYDSTRNTFGSYVARTSPSGAVSDLGNILFQSLDGSPDADGDGLPDLAEDVIGTDPRKFSTAGDGISDAVKIAQGLDPFGGRLAVNGIVAGLPLEGEAAEIAAADLTDAVGQQLLYVATGSYGLAIVDASKLTNPVVAGQLDLPGNAVGVAVDGGTSIAVVATNEGGLQFVDVSDATRPVLLRTIDVPASQVEVFEGVAYVAAGS